MRVLAIDTAGPVVGVALWTGASGDQRTERVTRGAEGLLLPWAEELCAEAGITFANLDAIGVAAGPGAFTGLRVGLATAAGLAQALDLPLWSGISLASRGARVGHDAPVLALLDARKSRVYAAIVAPDGTLIRAPEDVPPTDAVAWLPPGYLATGEGAVVYADQVAEAGGSLVGDPDHPSVLTLARLAAEGIARGEGHSPVALAPVYVRPPDAKPPKKGKIT